jgi:predicted phosphodiesterase
VIAVPSSKCYLAIFLSMIILLSVVIVTINLNQSFNESSHIILPTNILLTDTNNIQPNGNFEEGSADIAFGWSYENNVSAKAYRVNSSFYEGCYSYYLWTNSSCVETSSHGFNFVEGQSYALTYYAKTSFSNKEATPSEGYVVQIVVENATSEMTIYSSVPVKVTTDWTKYCHNWVMPIGYNLTKAFLKISLSLGSNPENVIGAESWTDSILITPFAPDGSLPSPLSPSSYSSSSSPSGNSYASVNLSKSIIADANIASVIVSEPFLIEYKDLPCNLQFSIYFNTLKSITTGDFNIELDNQALDVDSFAYNASTGMYDVTAKLPVVTIGNYMLKVVCDSQESLNFKGVGIYQYTGSFHVIHLTDIHFKLAIEDQITRTFKMVKEENPDFVLLTGDIHGSQENYIRFFSTLDSLGFNIPIFFTMGNHEKESLSMIDTAVLFFGQNSSRFGTEYPFSFDYGNFHFIGLDSSVYPFQSSGNISDNQYAWLLNDIKNNQNKHLVAFYHHPLYFQQQTEYDWIDFKVQAKLRNLFVSFNITSFTGHAHRSDLSILNETQFFNTVSVINDTHWVGGEPYPPGGYRTVYIVNEVIVSSSIQQTFSYYTGEFVGGKITDYKATATNQEENENPNQTSDHGSLVMSLSQPLFYKQNQSINKPLRCLPIVA